MAEVDQYRMLRDKEFRLRQSKIMGSQSNLADEIDKQTLEKIKELTGSYNTHAESMLTQVLNMVCDVKPEMHVNYRAAD